jgi:hypothetical protein
LTKCLWQIGNGGVYRPASKPSQSVLRRHGGEGGYEKHYKQSFLVYLAAKKLVYLIFVGFQETLPGFDQHLPANCSGFPLLFGAEHYQSLEIGLTNFGYHYQVDIFNNEFCNDFAF